MSGKNDKVEQAITITSGADRGGAMAKDTMGAVKGLIVQKKKHIEALLGDTMDAGRLARLALLTIRKTPKLMKCSAESLVGAILTAAQLGLEPDGILGQAYLVPYKTEATFMLGYRGMLVLADRSGKVASVRAQLVYSNDTLNVVYGDQPKFEHIPILTGERGDIIGAWCIATLKDGHKLIDYMTLEEMDHNRYSGHTGDSDAWKNHEGEMYRKTVLRRAFKFWPISTNMSRALALDEAGEAGVPQMLEMNLQTDDELTDRQVEVIGRGESTPVDAAPQGTDTDTDEGESTSVEAAQAELEAARQQAKEKAKAMDKDKTTEEAPKKKRGRPKGSGKVKTKSTKAPAKAPSTDSGPDAPPVESTGESNTGQSETSQDQPRFPPDYEEKVIAIGGDPSENLPNGKPRFTIGSKGDVKDHKTGEVYETEEAPEATEPETTEEAPPATEPAPGPKAPKKGRRVVDPPTGDKGGQGSFFE